MNTVDQRILIPAPPDVVWDFVKDIRNNAKWQAESRTVTFLTSRKDGQGARWRTTSDKGEQVIEITAWYEGLGYQYTYVDGMPFKENVGRIRLQEIPEGTVVQWTINYEIGGPFGGLRGGMGLSKRLHQMMEASLKALWKEVHNGTPSRDIREAKSLMREAPDVDARASYKPRHPAVVDVRSEHPDESFAPEAAAGPAISEPPIADDDTRPRPIVPPMAPPRKSIDELVRDAEEPDFLWGVQDDDVDHARFAPPAPDVMSDTHPIRTISPEELAAMPPAPAAESPFDFDTEFGFDAPAEDEHDDIARAVDELLGTGEDTHAPEHPSAELPRLVLDADDQAATVATVDEAFGPRPDVTDTSQASIWDIFGVPRPDEVLSEAAADAERPPLEAHEAAEATAPAPEMEATEPAFPVARAPDPEPAAFETPTVQSLPPVREPEPVALTTQELASLALVEVENGGHVGLRARARRVQVKVRRPA